MSAITADLGNVDYIYLKNTDANNGAGALNEAIATWALPYLSPRESSFMYIQVVQVMIHYAAGAGAVSGNNEPQYLAYNNLFGDNVYSSDSQTTLACILTRDTAAGQYICQSEAPIIRVPNNLSQIGFTIRNQLNNEVNNIGAAGSISILLKVIRPQRNVVQDNVLKTYTQTLDPRMTPRI